MDKTYSVTIEFSPASLSRQVRLLLRIVLPWVAAWGVLLIIRGQRAWFDRLDVIRPGAIPVLTGMALLLLSLRVSGIVLIPQPLVRRDGVLAYGRNLKLPLAALGVGMCIYAGWWAYPEDVSVWKILGLWLGGAALGVIGFVPHRHMVAWGRMVARSLREEWTTWLIVGVLFGIGLAVRVVRLGSAPYLFAGDEAQFGFESASMYKALHWVYNPFQLGIWHHPRTVHTVMAIGIRVLGQTEAAARLPWAIFGALTVPAVYLLGRRLFDARIGLIAALFMVSFPVHVQFSRTAMDMTGDPFFLALAFALLTRAIREGDTMEAALGGVSLGLSQYWYFAGRIAAALIVAFVLLHAARDPRGMWRRKTVLFIAAVLTAAVVFPNLYAMHMDKARSMSPRLKHVAIWETGAIDAARAEGRLVEFLERQTELSFLAYVHYQDESDVYGRFNPLLGWYAGVPFMIGLVVAVRRFTDPRHSLSALWVVGTAILGGALLVDPPHYPRYIDVTPALAMLVALGVAALAVILHDLATSVMLLVPVRRPSGRRAAAWRRWAIGVGLAVLLAGANLRSYVFDYLPATEDRRLLYGTNTIRLNEIVDILDTFQGRYQVFRLSSLDLDMNGTDLLRYLIPEDAGKEFDGEISRWREVLTPGPTAFVIAPQRIDEVMVKLVYYLPGGELREYRSTIDGEPIIWVYFVTVPEFVPVPKS